MYSYRRSAPDLLPGTCSLVQLPGVARVLRTSAPTLIDNTRLVPQVLDQGQLGSCELNAWAVAIQSSMWNAAGLGYPAPELPSRLFLYLAAQVCGGYDGQGDTGTSSDNVAQALATLGFVPESRDPYVDDPSKIDPGTYLEELKREAFDQRFGSTCRVDSPSMNVEQATNAMVTALQAGYLLPFAIGVDQDFEDYEYGTVWPGPQGPLLGGHCTCIVGYGPASSLSKFSTSVKSAFKVLNSWGPSWGDGGYYLMSPNALAQRYDVWACSQAAPVYSETR